MSLLPIIATLGRSAPPPAPPPATLPQRGVVLNQTSFADLASWSQSVAGIASISNSHILLSGGTGDFSKYLVYNPYTDCSEKIKVSVTYILNAAGSGIGVGKVSENGWYNMASVFGQIDHTTGKVMLYEGTTQKAISSASLVNTVGHSYTIIYEIFRDTVTVSAFDTASPGTVVSVSVVSDMNSSGTLDLINTSRIAFWAVGGTQEITGFVVERKSLLNADLLVIGNSKSHGVMASGIAHRYEDVLAAATGKFVEVWAGNGDRTVELVSSMSEILLHTPKRVLLAEMPRNDAAAGVATATWQGNYTTMRNQLAAAGIPIAHLLWIPESSFNWSSINTFINTFTSDVIIDPSPGFNTSTMIADGIHPNVLGYSQVATNLRTGLGW